MVANNAAVKETITVNQIISENVQQTVVRGTITIPDPKPDVEQIISTDKSASVKDVSLLPNKVVVGGKLNIQIVYVAFEPDQSVHHMHEQVPFTAYVDLEGALPDMAVQVEVAVEDVKLTPNKKDVRKFDVTAVLQVYARVTETQEVEVMVQAPDDTNANYETIRIDDVVSREITQVIVSDEFDEADEKPEPQKILDVDSTVNITDTRIVSDKVIVDGEVTLQVMYVGHVPEQSVHEISHTIPFTDYIDMPGAEPDMDVFVDAMVENCDVVIKGDPYFMADCVIKIDARVTEPREVRVVTECAGATVETVELNVEHLVGEDSSQVVVRETFETPDPKPCPEKILNVTIDKIEVTEKKVIRNKIITRGFVDVKIVYVSGMPDQAVHAMHQRLDFRTFVEINGADQDMDVKVKPMVEYINAEVANCDVNIEAVIKVRVRVAESMRRTVCVDVVPDEDKDEDRECIPGQIYDHEIRAGDTLWSLAREYHTTVQNIQALNPGINANNLRVGQVIRIRCGAMG